MDIGTYIEYFSLNGLGAIGPDGQIFDGYVVPKISRQYFDIIKDNRRKSMI